ncbi:MAG: FtsQ-type POTRA domain-containing protein [Deltaproteobacteria bacterium]|nr:MAG: FtsQ-type POTRA domain-containing protein [Deltaproteobacteria bacterium]
MARRNRKRRDPAETTAKVKGVAGTALRTAVRLLLSAILVAGTFSAVVGVYIWATTSPRFAVTDVRISGNARAKLSELAALSGLRAGTNLFLVSEEAVARQIERHPWVKAAAVEKRLPHTVEIVVEEHVPEALAVLDGLYLVSTEGVPFKPLGPGEVYDLPVVTGITLGGRREGRRGSAGGAGPVEDSAEAGAPAAETALQTVQPKLRSALSFIRAWKKAGLDDKMTLSEVNVDDVAGLTATARPVEGGPPVVVHMGEGELSRRLARLVQLHEVLRKRSQRPLEIFLNNHTRPQWVVARVEP